MSRVLIVIAAVLLLREFLPPRPRKSPTAVSPYMNSLDGLMSAQQISIVMDELRLRDTHPIEEPSAKHPPAAAA